MYYTNPHANRRNNGYCDSVYNKRSTVQFVTTSSDSDDGETKATSCTSVTTIQSYRAVLASPPRRLVPEPANHYGYRSSQSEFSCLRSACLPQSMSAFPSTANPSEKRRTRTGVTVVNVYNNTEDKPKRVRGGGKDRKVAAAAAPVVPTTDETQKTEDDASARRKKKKEGGRCMATNEERAEAELETRRPALPQWHDEERKNKKNRVVGGYNSSKAKQDWDEFYAIDEDKRTPAKNGSRDVAKDTNQRNAGKNKSREENKTVSVELEPPSPPRKSKENGQDDHECRPFYGSTEAARIAQQSINHLLKAEKELRRLHFVAGPVLPQSKQYYEQVDAIHTDLKLFVTQYRELQEETDRVLQQKKGREATVFVAAPPRSASPFPGAHSHGFTLQ